MYTFTTSTGKTKVFGLEDIPGILTGAVKHVDPGLSSCGEKYTRIALSNAESVPITEHPLWNDAKAVDAIVSVAAEDTNARYNVGLYPDNPLVSMAFAKRGILPRVFTQESADIYIAHNSINLVYIPEKFTKYEQWLNWSQEIYFYYGVYEIPERFRTKEICDIVFRRFGIKLDGPVVVG